MYTISASEATQAGGEETQAPLERQAIGTHGEILSIRGLSKSFGATRALVDVGLDVQAGEVHALVGQNGSGKSTLIKILSGYYAADAGEVRIRGGEAKMPLPAPELRRLGISFVHQDLGLVETMSILENLRVGRFQTGFGRRVRWRRERQLARELLRRFDLELDPLTPVSRLSQTERAIVAVIRALDDVEHSGGRGLLVLDEPTASLPVHEVELLFGAMRRVAQAGSSVLFVTHSLDEVLSIGDRVSVLRDGRVVSTGATSELDERRLIGLILGRDLDDLYPELPSRRATKAMEVRGLRGQVATDVDLDLHEGEILGLTGLVGAGHDEVPYLVYGARAPAAGTIALDGAEWSRPTPAGSKRAGIALLPADRQRQSGIPRATVRENVTLPALASYRRAFGLDQRGERTAVEAALERFSVKPGDPERRLYTLSGGNQQKAMLARWLELQPRVLLLHEPTQGVDVGARMGIFQILRDCAVAGTSVLYSSVEYEDLANICDRVLVFRRGRVAADLSGVALTAERIAEQCYRTGATA